VQETPHRSHPHPWRNVTVLSCTIFFTLTGLFSWERLRGLWLRDMGATELQIGWVLFLLAFANRLPQLIGGYLADRFGRRRMVAIMTMAMAFCYAGIGLAPTWPLAMACNAACWIIGAMQWPAMLLLVMEPVPEHQRGRAAAILEGASLAGVASGFLLGWFVLDRIDLMHGGWRLLCLVTAGCYLCCSIARGLGLVETAARNEKPLLAQLGAISWRIILLPTAVMVCASGAYVILADSSVQSFYLHDVSRFDERSINLVNFVWALVAMPAAFVAGWLADRFGSSRMIFVSCLLVIGMMAPFLVKGLPPSTAPVLFVLMALPAELFTVSWHKLITTITPAASRGLSVAASGMLAGFALPWASPLATSLYAENVRWPFIAAIATAVVGAMLALLVKKPRK